MIIISVIYRVADIEEEKCPETETGLETLSISFRRNHMKLQLN